jgi:hypothetical protein
MSKPISASLYRRLLSGYNQMPSALRSFHEKPQRATGIMNVRWNKGGLRTLAARVMKVPEPGENLVCNLTVTETGMGEMWDRVFGKTRIITRQWIHKGFLIEQGGPFRFRMSVCADREGMTFRQVGCGLGPIPLPKFLAPTVQADVKGDDEGWQVHVEIGAPLLGWICLYEGRMVPECK